MDHGGRGRDEGPFALEALQEARAALAREAAGEAAPGPWGPSAPGAEAGFEAFGPEEPPGGAGEAPGAGGAGWGEEREALADEAWELEGSMGSRPDPAALPGEAWASGAGAGEAPWAEAAELPSPEALEAPFGDALETPFGEVLETPLGEALAATPAEAEAYAFGEEAPSDEVQLEREADLEAGAEEAPSDGEAAAEGELPRPAPAAGPGRSTSLPFLLAGPIVRRAERRGVWFWFACSEEVTACRPHLTVYDKDGKVVDRLTDQAGEFRLAPAEWKVVRLGEHLWVVLAVARPRSDEFPVDWIYGYDLDIEYRLGAARRTVKLSTLGLALAYRPYPLPTFLLARETRQLVHGSCRRPGAPGPDAFLAFDRWLSGQITDVAARPSSLLLTGDQIYADDVATPLFKALHGLAPLVCGWVEELPRPGGGRAPADRWACCTGSPGTAAQPTRKGLTSLGNSPIGFTTDDGESHLLSFPEWAAMYLVTWNEALCRSTRVDDGTDANLAGFTAAVAAARRVLANCATYMVADDHEITDDWNLDADWEKATKNPTAQRILANGLAAFWAFQAWGNDPEAYDAAFVDAVVRHLDAMRKARGVPGAEAAGYERTLLGRHWSFVAPTAPPALCVDTRTRRETLAGRTATLSGRRVWPELEKLAQRHGLPKGEPLLLVLPTPLLPHRAMMFGQAHAFKWPSERYAGDYELYANNPGQRSDLIVFLKRLLDPPALVIFSGDVHHGSVIDGLYVHGPSLRDIYGRKGDWAIRIVQVTSSPIKNVVKKAYLEKHWWLGGTDKGNAGESLVPLFENQYTTLGPGSVLALRADAVRLRGPLGRETFVFENHLCVVEIPQTSLGEVKVLFVGEQGGAVATSRAAVGITNRPGDFKPPPPRPPTTPRHWREAEAEGAEGRELPT